LNHWYVKGQVPSGKTKNDTSCPGSTDWDAGGTVRVGALGAGGTPANVTTPTPDQRATTSGTTATGSSA
jgi:hypothetical protein